MLNQLQCGSRPEALIDHTPEVSKGQPCCSRLALGRVSRTPENIYLESGIEHGRRLNGS